MYATQSSSSLSQAQMTSLAVMDDVCINNWKPPEGNSYKLNFDASFTMGEVGFGAIVHNCNGEPKIAMQKALKFVSAVEHVETTTLLDEIITVEANIIIYQ